MVAGRFGGQAAAAIIAAASLIAACSSAVPVQPRASLTPGASAVVSPQTAAPSPSIAGSTDPVADLEHGPFPTGCVDQAYTTPLLDAKTDGRRLIWSSGANHGAPDAASDLFVVEPGSATAPRVAFDNPSRDSLLINLVGNGGSIVFVEQNVRLYGDAGWRLWLLNPDQPTPLAIDTSDSAPGAGSPLPFPSMNGTDVVWTAVHKIGGGLRYELLDYSIPAGRTRVIASASATTTEYWFPSLAQDGALVYATVEPHTAGPEFHIYLTSLAGARATRLDPSGGVTTPAFNGSVVLWKRVAENVFEAGGLELYDLATGSVTPIQVGRQMAVNYPSVDARYGAVWGNDAKDFEIVDLASARSVVVQRWNETYPFGIVRPQIAGDLMVYVIGPDDPAAGDLRLCWARLPG